MNRVVYFIAREVDGKLEYGCIGNSGKIPRVFHRASDAKSSPDMNFYPILIPVDVYLPEERTK